METKMKIIICIEALIEKAADADLAPDSVNFAQAAFNAANALHILAKIKENTYSGNIAELGKSSIA